MSNVLEYYASRIPWPPPCNRLEPASRYGAGEKKRRKCKKNYHKIRSRNTLLAVLSCRFCRDLCIAFNDPARRVGMLYVLIGNIEK